MPTPCEENSVARKRRLRCFWRVRKTANYCATRSGQRTTGFRSLTADSTTQTQFFDEGCKYNLELQKWAEDHGKGPDALWQVLCDYTKMAMRSMEENGAPFEVEPLVMAPDGKPKRGSLLDVDRSEFGDWANMAGI